MRALRLLVNWGIAVFPFAVIVMMLLNGDFKTFANDPALSSKRWIWEA